MDQSEVSTILQRLEVIRQGHFVYAGGEHGPAYVDKDMLFPHTEEVSRLCREIAVLALASLHHTQEIEVVVAPEKGGIILSQWVAYHLSKLTGREVLAFYAEKGVVGSLVLRRGNAAARIACKRVLVVEDILNTGGSAQKTIEAVMDCGGIVVGVGSICNRGGVTASSLRVPELFSLLDLDLRKYPLSECPLCRQGVKVDTEVGHGREFLASLSRGA